MLLNLSIRDFAIVDQIEVDFSAGMTVLTGETGAGKSILVDALGLVLGDRGSSQMVRDGARRADFAAAFSLDALGEVRLWLESNSLDADDECLVRRVIGADGRSRAFINGNAVTLQQLRDLGDMLVDIHGQHFHQSLGRRAVQRDLLDHFGGLNAQRDAVADAFERWQARKAEHEALLAADADRASRLDLLTFQLNEIDTLVLEDDEVAALKAERQRLAAGGRLLAGASRALDQLSENEAANATSLVAEAARQVDGLTAFDEALTGVSELLEGAAIQLSEASEELQRYLDSVDMDPARQDWVEERLDTLTVIARKHRVEPEGLLEQAALLRSEHEALVNAEARGQELEHEAGAARDAYFDLAGKLSAARTEAATRFAAAVTDAMAGLGMPGGRFEVELQALPEESVRPWGSDDIEFLISANPGQSPMPLAKVASGGELSRMSLAIQVIGSAGSRIPTMVFDEVDSGVGGSVAEMVGRRLSDLGADRQVLCVTHLPQVASLADQHLRISKVTDGKSTRTGVNPLDRPERIEELARMLGGVEITRTTLAHAEEMLESAPSDREDREKRA